MKIAFKLLSILALVMLTGLSTILWYKFKQLPQALKQFSYYIFGSLLVQSAAYVLFEFGENNLLLVHFYSLFQFVSLSLFYKVVMDSQWKKTLILVLTVMISLLMILNSVYNEKIQGLNSLGVFTSNGILIIYAVMYYFQFIDKEINDRRNGYLLINTGILFFMAESLILFLFGNLLKEINFIGQAGLWMVNVGVYLIFLVLVFVELWRHQLKEKRI